VNPTEDQRIRHARVKEILFEVLRLPREARSAYLVKACAGDGDLRLEVESLLEFDDGSIEGAVGSWSPDGDPEDPDL
jgi:hypothetical protein